MTKITWRHGRDGRVRTSEVEDDKAGRALEMLMDLDHEVIEVEQS
jgi:hypothetical protein